MLLAPTAGADTLAGFATDDVVDGLAGNDSINGRSGNDVLLGGEEIALVDEYEQVAGLDLEELTQLAEHFAVEAVHPVVVVAIQGGARDAGAATDVGHLEALGAEDGG
jgi:Ca2+-binding RTX toxin-like protein